MKKACFFVHNWRTFLVSLVIIKRMGWGRDDVIFVSARDFHAKVNEAGLASLNLDQIFSVPYQYKVNMSGWGTLRKCSYLVRSCIGQVNILFLPHLRDPMMQLVATSCIFTRLDFIEEGCLFPRFQIISCAPDSDWLDLIANTVLKTEEFFAVPTFLSRRLGRRPFLYITDDNYNLKGIDLVTISDEEILNAYQDRFPSGSDISQVSQNQLIVIGTKDDSSEIVLKKTISIASKLSKHHQLSLTYHPHPSLLLNSGRYLVEMSRRHGFAISRITCIDVLLLSNLRMVLCGDASTICITAKRLGHKYYLTTNYIKDVLPPRPHQQDYSVKKMLEDSSTPYPEILL